MSALAAWWRRRRAAAKLRRGQCGNDECRRPLPDDALPGDFCSQTCLDVDLQEWASRW